MNSQLGDACQRGDALLVGELMAGGHSPDKPLDTTGTTPLMAAATLEVVDILLEAGASLTPTRFGHDALQVVVSDEDSAIDDRAARLAAAHRLIECGAPLDRRNAEGWSRLHLAAFAGDAGAVAALLALGADPNDEPPALAAVCWGSGDGSDTTERIIDLLVNAGGDVHHRDRAGWTLLHAAAMPYSHGVDFESSDGPSVSAIRALIRHGLPPDVVGPRGVTALMVVAGDGAVAALNALLEAGSSPELRDDAGRRATDHARDSERQLNRVLADASEQTADAVRRFRDRVHLCVERLSAQ